MQMLTMNFTTSKVVFSVHIMYTTICNNCMSIENEYDANSVSFCSSNLQKDTYLSIPTNQSVWLGFSIIVVFV